MFFKKNLKIKNPSTLKAIVDKLSPLTLINTDSEIKGDAFEYFLKSLVMGNDLGEYFTPRHIVKLMVRLVDPKFGETVYDPACGTGGFLIEAFKHIKKSCKLTKSNIDTLKHKTVFGIELTDTARIAKMNMILTGDGHTNIKQYDSLGKPIKNKYDIALTNFPFSQKTDYGGLYGFDTNDANPIFLKHIVDSLVDGGRAAVITFQGVLYDSTTVYKNIRRHLLENCNIEAVIKLHNFVFRPYTGVHTSILIFKKGQPTKKVWFFKVDNDGFKKTSSKKGRLPIKDNDLEFLERIWAAKEYTVRSWSATFTEIKDNDYNLNAETYKPLWSTTSAYPLVYLNDDKYFEIAKGIEVGSDTYCGENEGIPFIRVGDLTGDGYLKVHTKSSNYVGVNEDDILLTFDGTIGVVGRGFKGAISAGIRKIQSKDEIEILNDYLYYILQSTWVKKIMMRFCNESIIAHSGRSFKHIHIPKLPIDIQRNFAKKIGSKENQIKKIDELLLTYSKNVVDDDLFSFTDVETKKLGELIIGNLQNGIYKPKTFYGPGIPIVRIDNIYDGQLFIRNINKLGITDEELVKYNLKSGDIILNRVNSEDFVGKCCVYNGEFSECVFESNMMRFRVNEPEVLPEYVVFYLTSGKGRMQILSKRKSAINQVSINQGDIKSIKIPKPDINKQKEIVEKVNKIIKTIENLKEIREDIKKNIEEEINKFFNF